MSGQAQTQNGPKYLENFHSASDAQTILLAIAAVRLINEAPSAHAKP